jgi:hypothetical protein
MKYLRQRMLRSILQLAIGRRERESGWVSSVFEEPHVTETLPLLLANFSSKEGPQPYGARKPKHGICLTTFVVVTRKRVWKGSKWQA